MLVLSAVFGLVLAGIGFAARKGALQTGGKHVGWVVAVLCLGLATWIGVSGRLSALAQTEGWTLAWPGIVEQISRSAETPTQINTNHRPLHLIVDANSELLVGTNRGLVQLSVTDRPLIEGEVVGLDSLPDGTVVVATRQRGLWFIDSKGTATSWNTSTGAIVALAVRASDGLIAVATENSDVIIFGPNGNAPHRTISTAHLADRLAFDRAGRLMILSKRARELWSYDTTGGNLLRTLKVQRPTRDLVALGNHIYLTATGYTTDADERPNDHEIHHLILEIDPEWLKVTRILDTARKMHWPGFSRKALARSGALATPIGASGLDPGSISASRDGNRLLIVFRGSDEIGSWSPTNGDYWTVDLGHRYGLAAPASVIDIDGRQMAVADPFGGKVWIGTRDTPTHWKEITLGSEAPDGPIQRGERAFYAATRKGISCQSCHHDGATDFGEHNIGPRTCQTLTTAGITETAPYFRIMRKDGQYPDLASLHREVTRDFGGYPGQPPGSSEDVAEFLSSLPRRTTGVLAGTSELALREGQKVFETANCHVCHPAPLYTNRQRIRSAWLFPEHQEYASGALLDVPSLLLLNDRGRFLADGRAATLESVFRDHNPADRHGATSSLSENEFNQLLEFLRQL